MSKYITRVHLKNAEQGDYDRLDKEMEKGSFVRVRQPGVSPGSTVQGAREYRYHGITTIQAVITAAYTAAGRLGRQYSLTVMKEKRVIPA
jgi:hypothetical protein